MPGARYFVTVCALRPSDALIRPETAQAIQRSLESVCAGGDGSLLCATIMPDHVHLLLKLGERLGIGQVAGKFKSLNRGDLAIAGAAWQRDFFEHRLRPNESADSYARYIFMNPYRGGLIERRAQWPWWWLGENTEFDFIAMLDDGLYPPPEWTDGDLGALGLRAKDVGE